MKNNLKKEKPKVPLWLNALTRAKNEEALEGKKGDIWVCGLDSNQPWCEETNCEYCNRACYYFPCNEDLVKKNAKKICPVCALEKHSDDLSEEIRRMLGGVVEDFR